MIRSKEKILRYSAQITIYRIPRVFYLVRRQG